MKKKIKPTDRSFFIKVKLLKFPFCCFIKSLKHVGERLRDSLEVTELKVYKDGSRIKGYL